MCRRRVIAGIFWALMVAGAVRAKMVLADALEAEQQKPVGVCGGTEVRHASVSAPFGRPCVANLGFWPVQFLPEAAADIGQSAQVSHSIDLTGGPGSYSLCLYALIGLGLCSSPHWVRKLRFGHIPEWYHKGSPFQIGHSHALGPQSLYPLPVCCFVQPVLGGPHIPKHRLRTILSCWRKSQFTPDVMASRGPPT